ncbi:hypothetical protein GCM10007049_33790 [Echinicola pacifica]|uniref:NusG-like N-terminal domain-containing protein n=1 Tax=Echinicola pacifica TaxID=346377 RepID=A0A918Q9C1_9BACT|nr:UpxY family transcription antiterminator [Echinicola pacifica]GGZ37789.1 hypothetical protein GCM10007049_33790 [Echinicola pacifica]
MSTERNWYVLYTAPRAEKKVAQRLEENGGEVYLPMIEEIRQWSDRKKKVSRPLFNGYVFVKTEKNKLWETLQIQGAVKFVNFSGDHAIVRDFEIEAIKRVVSTGVSIEVNTDNLSPGKQVRIIGGPMQGFEGECIQKANQDFFIIRVPSIHQTVMVNVPSKFLQIKD